MPADGSRAEQPDGETDQWEGDDVMTNQLERSDGLSDVITNQLEQGDWFSDVMTNQLDHGDGFSGVVTNQSERGDGQNDVITNQFERGDVLTNQSERGKGQCDVITNQSERGNEWGDKLDVQWSNLSERNGLEDVVVSNHSEQSVSKGGNRLEQNEYWGNVESNESEKSVQESYKRTEQLLECVRSSNGNSEPVQRGQQFENHKYESSDKSPDAVAERLGKRTDWVSAEARQSVSYDECSNSTSADVTVKLGVGNSGIDCMRGFETCNGYGGGTDMVIGSVCEMIELCVGNDEVLNAECISVTKDNLGVEAKCDDYGLIDNGQLSDSDHQILQNDMTVFKDNAGLQNLNYKLEKMKTSVVYNAQLCDESTDSVVIGDCLSNKGRSIQNDFDTHCLNNGNDKTDDYLQNNTMISDSNVDDVRHDVMNRSYELSIASKNKTERVLEDELGNYPLITGDDVFDETPCAIICDPNKLGNRDGDIISKTEVKYSQKQVDTEFENYSLITNADNGRRMYDCNEHTSEHDFSAGNKYASGVDRNEIRELKDNDNNEAYQSFGSSLNDRDVQCNNIYNSDDLICNSNRTGAIPKRVDVEGRTVKSVERNVEKCNGISPKQRKDRVEEMNGDKGASDVAVTLDLESFLQYSDSIQAEIERYERDFNVLRRDVDNQILETDDLFRDVVLGNVDDDVTKTPDVEVKTPIHEVLGHVAKPTAVMGSSYCAEAECLNVKPERELNATYSISDQDTTHSLCDSFEFDCQENESFFTYAETNPADIPYLETALHQSGSLPTLDLDVKLRLKSPESAVKSPDDESNSEFSDMVMISSTEVIPDVIQGKESSKVDYDEVGFDVNDLLYDDADERSNAVRSTNDDDIVSANERFLSRLEEKFIAKICTGDVLNETSEACTDTNTCSDVEDYDELATNGTPEAPLSGDDSTSSTLPDNAVNETGGDVTDEDDGEQLPVDTPVVDDKPFVVGNVQDGEDANKTRDAVIPGETSIPDICIISCSDEDINSVAVCKIVVDNVNDVLPDEDIDDNVGDCTVDEELAVDDGGNTTEVSSDVEGKKESNDDKPDKDESLPSSSKPIFCKYGSDYGSIDDYEGSGIVSKENRGKGASGVGGGKKEGRKKARDEKEPNGFT